LVGPKTVPQEIQAAVRFQTGNVDASIDTSRIDGLAIQYIQMWQPRIFRRCERPAPPKTAIAGTLYGPHALFRCMDKRRTIKSDVCGQLQEAVLLLLPDRIDRLLKHRPRGEQFFRDLVVAGTVIYRCQRISLKSATRRIGKIFRRRFAQGTMRRTISSFAAVQADF
jgi:hypothetical protein